MRNTGEIDSNSIEAAYKAISSFFYNVTTLFTNILTASGRNNHSGGVSFGMHREH